MNTHTLLFKHQGEVSHTKRDPYAVVISRDGDLVVAQRHFDDEPFEVDLTEEKMALVGHDNWQQIPVKLWGVKDVELPSWMDPHVYAVSTSLHVMVKYMTGLGASLEWGEDWWKRIWKFNSARRLAVIKLLSTENFRSDFRKSLNEQLVAWLNGESDYPSPFSPRQWECLTRYTAVEAKQREKAIYWNR